MTGFFQQVRIVPKYDRFTVEFVMLIGKKIEIGAKKERCMGVDLGIDNIASVATNTGMTPCLFKGGRVKCVNQWYNKMRSRYYAVLRNGKKGHKSVYQTRRLIGFD
ncbi:hypothetical protein R4Z09_12855 [Niallia oryzisoli]|uniref:Transposase n=1 Tax=Niallia oryzisoli TaxID=1737571 RepID=A0ABZ2CJ39_9BACI